MCIRASKQLFSISVLISGLVNSLQTCTIPRNSATVNVYIAGNLSELSGWVLGSERVARNKNDVKFTLWTAVHIVQFLSRKESHGRALGKEMCLGVPGQRW